MYIYLSIYLNTHIHIYICICIYTYNRGCSETRRPPAAAACHERRGVALVTIYMHICKYTYIYIHIYI